MIHLPRYLALALAATSLCNCSSAPEVPENRTVDSRAWWKGDGVPGERKIVIDLSAQRLRYYKGSELVGVSPISSGTEGRSTLNGNFRVLDKDIDHRSSLYGAFVDGEGSIVESDVDSRTDRPPAGAKFRGASMRYFMRFVGGIGMHEGYLPGYPASHGCIRLPTRMAEIFYHDTPVGTPVQVVGHGTLAATEQAIPVGHGHVALAEPRTDDDDEVQDDDDEPRITRGRAVKAEVAATTAAGVKTETKTKAKPETVRPAVVASVNPGGSSARANRFQTARELRKKYNKQRGGTMYYLD